MNEKHAYLRDHIRNFTPGAAAHFYNPSLTSAASAPPSATFSTPYFQNTIAPFSHQSAGKSTFDSENVISTSPWNPRYVMGHQKVPPTPTGSSAMPVLTPLSLTGSNTGPAHWPPSLSQQSADNDDNIGQFPTEGAVLGDLTKELEHKEEAVADLKLQVEALMTALTLAEGSRSVTTADGMEMAHRILTRLKSLRAENEQLMQLVSGSYAAELEAVVDRLKHENDALKRQLMLHNA